MNNLVYTLDWKYIPGYNKKYLLNKLGIVVSFLPNGKSKILKSRVDRAGYETVRLFQNGKTKTYYLHRLIAELFILNECNKNHVNHKSGEKTNNWYENLEWVTHSENIKHAYAIGLCKLESRQIPIIDICSGKKFPSIKKAAEFNLIKYSTCKGYLNGSRPNPTCLRYLS